MALSEGLRELALFAGAGGGILGGILSGFRTVCAVEKEPYCREVLLRRQRDGVLPLFPLWDDIKTFDGRPWRGAVDIVTAGFPCQPFSVAGQRKGPDDERNLWPDTIRVVREVGADFILLENVPGLVSCGYLGRVLRDLAAAGYDAEWDCISAAEVGAPHLRRRLWIVAYSCCPEWREKPERRDDANWKNIGRKKASGWIGTDGHGEGSSTDAIGTKLRDESRRCRGTERPNSSESGHTCAKRPSTYTSGSGLEKLQCECESRDDGSEQSTIERDYLWWDWREAPPPLCGVDDVVAHRLDQLRALGNGQVARVAQEAWERLKGLNEPHICPADGRPDHGEQ